MKKREEKDTITMYVLKNKQGKYFGEGCYRTKLLKKAQLFVSRKAANSWLKYHPDCKPVPVKVYSLQTIEEIGEVKE